MDAVGFGKAVLFCFERGWPGRHCLAARRPERTRALILHGTYAYLGGLEWDDLDRSSSEVRARILRELSADFTAVDAADRCAGRNSGDAVRSDWGDGRGNQVSGAVGSVDRASSECWSGCARAPEWHGRQSKRRSGSTCGRYCRRSPSRPSSSMPAATPGCRCRMAEYSPTTSLGAQILEVEGVDHAPWFTDPDKTATRIEEFLTGSHAAPPRSRRALHTMLFTDMVASTQHAAAAGDERWRAVLQRLMKSRGEITQRFEGAVVKSTGDGHLATFDGPTQAIRCAEALRAEAETLGIRIRPASIRASANCSRRT